MGVLSWQNIDVRFGQGVDQKTDKLQTPVGKLRQLVNGRIEKTGQIVRRKGFAELPRTVGPDFATDPSGSSGSTLPNAALRAAVHDAQLAVFDGAEGYVYAPTAQRWARLGAVPSVTATTQAVAMSSADAINADSAIAQGHECIVWEDTGSGFHLLVRDLATKTVTARIDFTGGFTGRLKVLPWGTDAEHPQFLVLGINANAPADLRYMLVDPLHPGISSAQQVPGTTGITQHYDACTIGDTLYLVWSVAVDGVHVPVLRARRYSRAMVEIGAIVTFTPSGSVSGSTSCVAVAPGPPLQTGGQRVVILCGWYATADSTPHLYGAIMAQDLVTGATMPDLVSAGGRVMRVAARALPTAASSFDVAFEANPNPASATARPSLWTMQVATAGTYGTPARIRWRCGLAGKPFAQSGTIYIPVCYYATLTAENGIITQSGVDVARYNVGLAPPVPSSSVLRESVQTGLTSWSIAGHRLGNLRAQDGRLVSTAGVSRTEFEFRDAHAYGHARMCGETLITGGVMSRWDGLTATEDGFLDRPEIQSVASVDPGGSPVPAGKYQFVFTYQWYDALGQVHESAPSIPTEITADGAHAIACTVTTTSRTRKQGIRIVGYRTGDLDTSADPTFYRFVPTESTDDYAIPNAATETVVATCNAVSFSTSNDILYTTGGVLENSPPPPCDRVFAHRSRAWARDTDNANTIWYSKTLVPGRPVEWSDKLTIQVDERLGQVSAIGAIDSHLVLFTPTSIYTLSGSGPNNSGLQNDFGDPEPLTTDVGCTNQNSVVCVPSGLMFQSAKGIYLLDRAMQLHPIGSPVENLGSEPIVSAVVMHDASEVRLETASCTLVYSHLYDQWSTFSMQGQASGVSDSGVWMGTYYRAGTQGRVYVEADDYADPNGVSPLVIETGWISFAGLQGYQRIRDVVLLASPVVPPVTPTIAGTVDLTTIPITYLRDRCFRIYVDNSPHDVAIEGPLASLAAFVTALQDAVSAHGVTVALGASSNLVLTTEGASMRVEAGSLNYDLPDLLSQLGIADGTSASRVAPHTIEMQCAYDYSESDVGQIASFSSGRVTSDREQFRMFMTKPKCSAIKLTITVWPDTGFEALEPCKLSGLTFRVGLLEGHARTPAGRQRGA